MSVSPVNGLCKSRQLTQSPFKGSSGKQIQQSPIGVTQLKQWEGLKGLRQAIKQGITGVETTAPSFQSPRVGGQQRGVRGALGCPPQGRNNIGMLQSEITISEKVEEKLVEDSITIDPMVKDKSSLEESAKRQLQEMDNSFNSQEERILFEEKVSTTQRKSPIGKLSSYFKLGSNNINTKEEEISAWKSAKSKLTSSGIEDERQNSLQATFFRQHQLSDQRGITSPSSIDLQKSSSGSISTTDFKRTIRQFSPRFKTQSSITSRLKTSETDLLTAGQTTTHRDQENNALGDLSTRFRFPTDLYRLSEKIQSNVGKRLSKAYGNASFSIDGIEELTPMSQTQSKSPLNKAASELITQIEQGMAMRRITVNQSKTSPIETLKYVNKGLIVKGSAPLTSKPKTNGLQTMPSFIDAFKAYLSKRENLINEIEGSQNQNYKWDDIRLLTSNSATRSPIRQREKLNQQQQYQQQQQEHQQQQLQSQGSSNFSIPSSLKTFILNKRYEVLRKQTNQRQSYLKTGRFEALTESSTSPNARKLDGSNSQQKLRETMMKIEKNPHQKSDSKIAGNFAISRTPTGKSIAQNANYYCSTSVQRSTHTYSKSISPNTFSDQDISQALTSQLNINSNTNCLQNNYIYQEIMKAVP